MDTLGKEYLPEGHLHAHAHFTLFRVTVSHLKCASAPPIKIDHSQCVGRIRTESQVIMTKASYLAILIGKPVRLKLIPAIALYADPGPTGGEIQEQLWRAALLALDTV